MRTNFGNKNGQLTLYPPKKWKEFLKINILFASWGMGTLKGSLIQFLINLVYLLSSSKMSVSLLITEKSLWISCWHVCVCLRKKPTEGRVYFLSWPQFLSVTRLQTSSVVYFLVIKVDETGHVYGQLKTVPGSYTSFFHMSILGVDSKYYFRQRYDFIPVSKSLE